MPSPHAARRQATAAGKSSRLTVRFVRRFWGALVVGLVALSVVIAAVATPGLQINDVRLNEGAVYVVKNDAGLVGNLNLQSDELANAAQVGSNSLRVLQNGSTVLVNTVAETGQQLSAYDPATNTLGAPVQLPANARVSLNGELVAVTNVENGRVWVGTVDETLKTDFQLAKATFDVGEGGLAVVTTSGQVIGLSVVDSSVVRGEQKVPLPFAISGAGAVQLSAVGDRAVVYDDNSKQIWVEGEDRAWDVAGGSTTQLAAPTASVAGIDQALAVYSTGAGLIALTKDGPRSLSGLINQGSTEAPVAPIVVGNCAYGAFGTQFVQRCAGEQNPTIKPIPEAAANAQLTFGTNRGQVVLNQPSNGWIWMVGKDLKLIKDWSKVTPAEAKDNQNTDETEKLTQPKRDQPNTRPVAQNDTLSARVGRSTVLTVLDNDSDADGDILTFADTPKVEKGSVQVINGGTGLQITVPPDATGDYQFSYTITDGRGGTATAQVRVKTLPADQNAVNQPPYLFRKNEVLRLGQSQKLTKRALLDWRDPDGDDLVLVDASVKGGDDEVTFTSDGQVTFQDVGKTTGLKEVELTVSDGTSVKAVDIMKVMVEPLGTAVPPIANGDFVTTAVGKSVVVSPLSNDVGLNLQLSAVQLETSGKATALANFQEGTFTFRAEQAGTFYVTYTVSSGPTATGVVRVDVVDPARTNNAPVAARDVVLLPPGGSVLVDPLLNDSDADGDVLVIQQVSEDPHLSVVMEQRRVLTITSELTPPGPVTLSYWISDGVSLVQGTIVVIPVAQVGPQAPQANPDTIRARAGSIVSVPVLENDSSPLGLSLSIDKLIKDPNTQAWIDGDQIRVAAPVGANATSVTLTYQVKDSAGRTDSAVVTISVVTADAQNQAPTPVSVEARVLSGTTTQIIIPLTNIDPQGDPVRLLGLNRAPVLGRITAVGEHYLSYEAFASSRGTDIFSYQVVDSLGAVGVGEVRVGVAPPNAANTPPTLIPDEVTVRPSRPVTLPLLQNDFDNDGDSFGFVADKPVTLDAGNVSVNDAGAVLFTAPAAEGAVAGSYSVQDSRKGVSQGSFTVRVSAQAPNLPPVAVDDLVNVAEVVDKEFVDIAVTKNDYDPDGSSAEMKIGLGPEVNPELVTVDQQKKTVQVKVGKNAQQVRYTLTDAEGGVANAVVTVPGTDDIVPMLKKPDQTLKMVAGTPFQVVVNDLVQGTQGRKVVFLAEDRFEATNGTTLFSPDVVTWTPSVSFAGQAALVFAVVDQAPAGDKTAKTSVISIPVTVTPAPNAKSDGANDPVIDQPPRLVTTNPPVLKVGQGESAQINLQTYYEDPERSDIRFDGWKAANSVAAITWKQLDSGSTISATATFEAPVGTKMVVNGSVIDGVNNSNNAQVTIEVVASTRPPVTVVDDVVDDANAGSPVTVPVLANDKSNLVGDTSLHLIRAAALNGGSATVNGNNVVVTPDEGFVGDMTVTYVVVDATKSEARYREGRIRLSVRAAPGKPGVPVQQEVGDGFVVIKWTQGALNGLPLGTQTVNGSAPNGASVSQECATNTCKITGLTNDRGYTFTVTQTNEIGQAVSGSSAVMTPDVVPEKMSAPTVKFGDGELAVSWPAAVSRGSAVSTYTLKNLTTNESREIAATSTSTVWKGLTNGTNYQFTVFATNKKGAGGVSGPSAVEHPTGPPPAASNVVGADRGDAQGGFIKITFNLPAVKVDPILTYDLLRFPGGQAIRSGVQVQGAGQQTLDIESSNGVEYQFAVVLHNRSPKAGPQSPKSAPVSSFGAPVTPEGTAVTFGDRAITVVSIPGTGSGGGPRTKTEVKVFDHDTSRDVSEWITVDEGSTVPTPFNGPTYGLKVRSYSENKVSGEGGTKSGITRGAPRAPTYHPGVVYIDGGKIYTNFSVSIPVDYTRSSDNYEFNNGNQMHQIDMSYVVGSGSAVAIEPGELVPIDTTNAPANLTLTASSRGFGFNQATQVLPAPFVATATSSTLSVTLTRWPDSRTSCFVDGAYTGVMNFDNASSGDGQTETASLVPAAAGGTPGASWTVTCRAGGDSVSKSGKVPS